MTKNSGNKKSQLVSIDLMIGVFIFSIIIIFLIVTWDDYIIRLDINLNENQILNTAFAFSDYLIKNPGVPGDWNNETVTYIGLADFDRKVNRQKFENLTQVNYTISKKLFRVDLFDYNYFINFTWPNNEYRNSYGAPPAVKSKNIIKIRRYVMYDGNISLFYLTLWK